MYKINHLAVVFHPQLDRLNKCHTIVCNWKNEKVIKITPFGYKILKIIADNPGISSKRIFSLLRNSQDENRNNHLTVEFLRVMILENIVYKL